MLPIFYINVASRMDRRAHIEAQLAALAVTGTRIEAVTPPEIADVVTPLNRGELACSRSHQKLWRLLVEQSIPAALILEDDVLLSADVPALLDDPRLLEGGVDAIQLETRRTSALVGPAISTAVKGVSRNRLMSSSLGSAAYVMTGAFAARLLARPGIDEIALDSLLFGRPGSLFYEARIFQVVPALAIQLDQTLKSRSDAVAKSDLDAHRPHRGPRRSLSDRLHRVANNLRHHSRVVRVFGASGELWGARQLRLPVAADLRRLI